MIIAVVCRSRGETVPSRIPQTKQTNASHCAPTHRTSRWLATQTARMSAGPAARASARGRECVCVRTGALGEAGLPGCRVPSCRSRQHTATPTRDNKAHSDGAARVGRQRNGAEGARSPRQRRRARRSRLVVLGAAVRAKHCRA
jgi:hypothetical protein